MFDPGNFDRNLIAMACAECHRQQVGPMRVLDLLDGWELARGLAESFVHGPFFVGDVLLIAQTIEPSNGGQYRTVPVTFPSFTGAAASHDSIRGAMDRLIDNLDDDTDVDEWIKAFLRIHPFIDGNGRTAWVLYNWIGGTLENPRPLPYYDFS